MAYICGDEASFVLTDYDELDTTAWMDYDKAKVESVMASLMSVAYGRGLRLMGLKDLPVFGALAFNVPEAEVANYFLWRRKHWESESVVAFGHRLLDAKLQGKSTLEKGHPWDWLPENVKCGTFLTCPTHEIAEHVSVPARYTEIAELWDTVRPKDLQPTTTTARATRSGGRRPRHKRWGIQAWSRWFKRWGGCYWYATEKARDQAFDDLKRHCRNILKETEHEPLYRKVER